MNIANLRADFLAKKRSAGHSQKHIAEQCGVEQAAISRFIAGKNGLSFDYVLKLWPYIYGYEFPEREPTHVTR